MNYGYTRAFAYHKLQEIKRALIEKSVQCGFFPRSVDELLYYQEEYDFWRELAGGKKHNLRDSVNHAIIPTVKEDMEIIKPVKIKLNSKVIYDIVYKAINNKDIEIKDYKIKGE